VVSSLLGLHPERWSLAGRPAAGLGLVLGGLAIVGLRRTPRRRLGSLFAGLAAGGAATVGGVGLAAAWSSGGPPAILGTSEAVSLLLIGTGILVAAARPFNSLTAQLAGSGATAISLLVLLGHVYRADALYTVPGEVPTTVWGAVGCTLLGAAVLMARPEYAVPRTLAGRSLGTEHLRRALPLLLLVPLASGSIALAGHRADWYGESVAFALFTLLGTAALAVLGASSARHLDLLARERARLENLFRRTFDNAAVGVAHLGPDIRWQLLNDRACEILGWSREELLGEDARAITLPEDRVLDESLIDGFRRGEIDSQYLEKRFRRKSGELVWVDFFVSCERDKSGDVSYYIAVLQDITDRKRAEGAKDAFFGLISHELRSPLNALSGWLAVLRSDTTPETRARAIQVADRSVWMLDRLIGDLLDASRIASGKLEIDREVFDLLEVVQGSIAMVEPIARSRGVSIALRTPDEAPFVAGDPQRIDQILRNLMDNAVKFTPAGGRIHIAVTPSDDASVQIVISDTGRGIPRSMLTRIFDPLEQGEAGPRGAGRGLGLGLTIVARLVELHGGCVEAASDGLGCGTTFTVTLPTTPIPQRLVPTTQTDDSDLLDGVQVLLVKPDRPAAEAVALILENANADVVWVRQLDEVIERPGLRPRVLVADLDALGDEAPRLLQTLRARTGDAELSAIATSAEDRMAARRRAREAGFDRLLSRPFAAADLIAAIQGLLERPTRVLVVDDDRDSADSLGILLARRGFEVERAYDASRALEIAADFRPDAILTDIEFGDDHDGVALARALRKREGAPPVLIAISGHSPEALGKDAELFDRVVRKPVDLDFLLPSLRRKG
jgi:PAS domain S-box-containing protein